MVDVARSGKEPTIERAGALDRVAEALERRPAVEVRSGMEASPALAPPSASMVTPPTLEARPIVTKSPLREDIEEALADGLVEIYAALPPAVQARFREEGEQIANRFEAMIATGVVIVRVVHDAIVRWLRIIPSRSTAFAYFLVQEAKVKTDAILALARRARGG